jgi:uncharacterized surface anchored protein
MRITIFLLFLCLFCSFVTVAQVAPSPYFVKGTIIDSSSNVRLQNTTIAVLNAKDSTLRQFTRADANGAFAMNKLSKGKFILMVTVPGLCRLYRTFYFRLC